MFPFSNNRRAFLRETTRRTGTCVEFGNTLIQDSKTPAEFSLLLLPSLALACLIGTAGCSGTGKKPTPAETDKPANRMTRDLSVPTSPPAGKTLVCFHRPYNKRGRWVTTGLWDGASFVGTVGTGHSIAYVCDPGQHYFSSRSAGPVGVVEAQLLPDKTYDLCVYVEGMANIMRVVPVKDIDRTQNRVATWSRENLWVKRDAAAAEFEQQNAQRVKEVLREYVEGNKTNRLAHLAASDHR